MTVVEEPACTLARSCSSDTNKIQKVEGGLQKAHGFKAESQYVGLWSNLLIHPHVFFIETMSKNLKDQGPTSYSLSPL